jgi:hypothetical protein
MNATMQRMTNKTTSIDKLVGRNVIPAYRWGVSDGN